MNIRDYMESSIAADIKKLEHFRRMFNGVKLKGVLIRRSSKNRKSPQYYYKEPGKGEKYLGRAKVKTIKALRLEVYDGENYFYKTYYPDFTIILPDGSKIIWEHKGMLSNEEYANRDIEKEIIYNMNGIYQSHNYIVTADGPNNDLDMEGIKRLVSGWLMPLACM